MLSFENLLIIFFLFLILYQIFLGDKNSNSKVSLFEGLENRYKTYDTNDPNNALILAQKNAGNISYIKENIGDINNMKQEIKTLNDKVHTLETQLNSILQSQKDYANQLTGGTPPDITGV